MKKAIHRKIHIGTSGWYYDYWKGLYYDEQTPSKEFLTQYSLDFETVEINNTFYRLPSIDAIRHWKKSVPKRFIFSLKASRYITHIKRLNEPKKSLKTFFQQIRPLKSQIGVILFLIPDYVPINCERFGNFLQMLPKGYRYAFEFRNPSWFDESIYELLRNHKAAFCIYDLNGKTSPKILTADFVYVRLHGPKRAYRGSYSQKALRLWAKDFEHWAKSGKEIFCYFNNDESAYAPLNALAMKKFIYYPR